KQGHIFELYPRFHCETNLIERFWGRLRKYICSHSQGKDARQALEAVKKFSKDQKSHQKLRLYQ
ncbi:hypothetical protein BD770DRAFT_389794, partial [Pilaira anomala]